MKIAKNDILFILFIGVVIVLGILSNATVKEVKQNKKDRIEKHLYSTVCKVESNNRRYLSYIYFYKNKIHTNSHSNQNIAGDSYVGKFYVVELSSKLPNYAKIFLEQEVTDSTRIANAGFRKKTLEEIIE